MPQFNDEDIDLLGASLEPSKQAQLISLLFFFSGVGFSIYGAVIGMGWLDSIFIAINIICFGYVITRIRMAWGIISRGDIIGLIRWIGMLYLTQIPMTAIPYFITLGIVTYIFQWVRVAIYLARTRKCTQHPYVYSKYLSAASICQGS